MAKAHPEAPAAPSIADGAAAVRPAATPKAPAAADPPTAAFILSRMRKGSEAREVVSDRIAVGLRKKLTDTEIADDLIGAVADALELPACEELHEVLRQLAAGQRNGRG